MYWRMGAAGVLPILYTLHVKRFIKLYTLNFHKTFTSKFL